MDPTTVRPKATALLGLIGRASVYLASGIALGGLLALAALFIPGLSADPHLVFLYALPVPPGLLYLWHASEKKFRQHLEFLRRLKEEGLIRSSEYDAHRKLALRWYALRRYGQADLEGPRPDQPDEKQPVREE